MKRTVIRENIFKLIFMSEFNDPEEMPSMIEVYLNGMEDEPGKKDARYIREKTGKILEKKGTIDGLINEKSSGWNISRIGKAELAIMRLAVYEILYDEDIPSSVAINEAVELAKKYGDQNAGSFVNGVLAKFAVMAEEAEKDGDKPEA